MSLDLGTITAVREELSGRITGMKIDKVQQPRRDTVILTLRGRQGASDKLLISAGVNDIRIHLTQHKFENPVSPPMFCMLLRKHLTGAKIEAVRQPPSERIIIFDLTTSTALGDPVKKQMVLELFGRLPNIILTGSDGIIIGCLQRVSGEMNNNAMPPGRRMILPGLKYNLPETPDINSSRPPAAGTPASAPARARSISDILDTQYTHKANTENIRRLGADMLKAMNTVYKRTERRLEAQRAELKNTADRDYLRQSADIIMANLHSIKKGDELLTADDFYADGDAKREIKLDPFLTPQKNAAVYYKEYTKARSAGQHLAKQIKNGEAELEYISSVIEQLERAENESELEEIHKELILTKYIKPKGRKAAGKKNIQLKPLEFITAGGIKIFAGRNNTQNDILTLKTASKTDIWMHTQKVQGAHVIIQTGGKPVSNTVLQEAAVIAAYYSAARGAGKVPVDYTQVKYVKKPGGALPGKVIYTNFKTIIAQADENLVSQLRV